MVGSSNSFVFEATSYVLIQYFHNPPPAGAKQLRDLYEKQSVFADSLVQLHNLTVTKCSGLFSISCAEVTDGKCSINLFTTKPYRKNEVINIEARYKVMFNYNGQTISALVTDDFPLHPNRLFNL